MRKYYVVAFFISGMLSLYVQADDGFESHKEVRKSYLEYQRERSKDNAEARRESRKFREEQR
ncbi:hypothetical protein ACM7HD_30795, partial [Pseudomonas aeruginosa]